jgi:hypothetical protein
MKFAPAVLLAAALLAGPARSEKPVAAAGAYDPADAYTEMRVEGWLVRVNKELLSPERRELKEKTLKLLGSHFYHIARVVPAEAVEKLRKVPVWVERAHPRHPCMCYHVSPDWLREHAMNPAKAGAVEIANAENFLTWTHQQPWMVLHELAHAYHHQVLGFDNAKVRACFDAAAAGKGYESVLHINGRKQRHYALSNDREYFAELTESYFGTNDFFPFVRAELKQHDPKMYDLLEEVWGVKPAKRK